MKKLSAIIALGVMTLTGCMEKAPDPIYDAKVTCVKREFIWIDNDGRTACIDPALVNEQQLTDLISKGY